MGRFSYTTGNRWFMLLVLVILVAGGVLVLVPSTIRQDGPPLLFTVFWFAAIAWNAYWWLWRISYRLEVEGARLRWKTPLRQGDVQTADIEAIRMAWMGRMAVIELNDQEDITVLSRSGIAEFASALAENRTIPVDASAPWGERLLGSPRSAFRRDD